MSWLSVVLWLVGTLVFILGPIILIHELGHFLAAKLFGVRVEEFGAGLPPRLVRLWRERGFVQVGRTRLTIARGSKVPFGLVTGSWVEATAVKNENEALTLLELRVLDPATGGPAIEPQAHGTGEVLVRGELTDYEPGTVYSLNLLPLGAFVKMTGEEDPTDPRSLASKPRGQRVAVLAAGAAMNLIAALIILTVAYASGLPTKWHVRITSVMEGSAAEEAGLLPGDIVTAINAVPIITGTEQLRAFVIPAAGRELTIEVQRGGATVVLTAVPRRGEDGNGLLGIVMDPWPSRGDLQYYSLPQAFTNATKHLGVVSVTLVRLPALLIRGQVAPQDVRPSSIVGISSFLTFDLQRSIAWGLPFPALQTAALISLALGLTNLLPVPALDGGRIVFVLIEAIRGRRIAPEREAAVHFIMLAVLVVLMVFLMVQDIINPIIPWSWLK